MKIVLVPLLILLTALQPCLPALAAEGEAACAPTKELNLAESSALHGFNSLLSNLSRSYGRPTFEVELRQMIDNAWPKTKLIQVSPTFFERAENLVDQARLRNSIALTVGLESDVWDKFDKHMRHITLTGSTANDLINPFDKTAARLIKAIKAAGKPASSRDTGDEWKLKKAEALARVSNMYAYLARWRVINGDISDQRAAASAKNVAMLALGLVGTGVLCSTFLISGPMVTGAGALTAGMTSNAVMASLLAKLAETAAGSMLGVIGAPAAQAMQDSYTTLSEASKQSQNRQTNYSCELSKSMAQWRETAINGYVSAAGSGALIGAGGGLLTFTKPGAKLVLYATGFGVGIAQLYTLGKMSELTMESLAYYKMAQEAEVEGDNAKARQLLFKARDLSQAAGQKGLESIIIATLSVYVTANFRHALNAGETAIRQLYANSADTLPLAGTAAANVLQSAILNQQENK